MQPRDIINFRLGNIVKPIILNSYSAIIEAMDQCGNTGNRHYRILMEDN